VPCTQIPRLAKFFHVSNPLTQTIFDSCISRQSALPNNQEIHESNIVWVSGLETWKNLAKRGIWVHGTSDGLGEDMEPKIKSLTNNEWIKLTHLHSPVSRIKNVIHTYELEKNEIYIIHLDI
jgi:hydroxymethylbilane synthase